MKHYVINQHVGIEYEGTTTNSVAVRICSEADIIAEVARLDAGVAYMNTRELMSYYYTYHELPTEGFSKDFDLENDDPEYSLISIRNRMQYCMARDHENYNTNQQNPFVLRCASFKEYFLRSSVPFEFLQTIDPEIIDKLFYEVFSDYVKSGISTRFSLNENYNSAA